MLRRVGAAIQAVIAPSALAALLPSDVRTIVDGSVVEARGRGHVEAVVVDAAGRRETVPCDALVLAAALVPRDGLLRQAVDGVVNGAGDVVEPGCTIERAMASGREAGLARPGCPARCRRPGVGAPPDGGIVCPARMSAPRSW